MAEFLGAQVDRFGKTVEYFPDQGRVRVSVHERPKETDPTATIIVPGWTGTPEVYAPVFDTVFAEGRNTAAFTYPEESPDIELSTEEVERASKLPPQLRRKALSLLHATEHTRRSDTRLNGPVDIFSHSEGFAVAVLAAHIRPSAFRDIVGYGPIGVAKSENWMRLLAGFVGQNLEKHDWGPEPRDIKELAHEYAQERRADIHAEWLSSGDRSAATEKDFEEHLNTYTDLLAADLTARKDAAAKRGITSVRPPTDDEKAEAARRRAISDSAFFKHLKGRPFRSFVEARELPKIRLAEMLQELSDEHGIGFAIAICGDDSVMHTLRRRLRILRDVLSIHKKKPRIHSFIDTDGVTRQRTVYDPVVRTLTLPGGGHQGVVGYPATTRGVEHMLTLLNRERV